MKHYLPKSKNKHVKHSNNFVKIRIIQACDSNKYRQPNFSILQESPLSIAHSE